MISSLADVLLANMPNNEHIFLWEERDGRICAMFAWESHQASRDLAGMPREALRRAIGWRTGRSRAARRPSARRAVR